MEAKQTGHLGLAAADLGGDLRLGHSRCGRLPHSPDQFGARTRDSVVGVAGYLCQTARHGLIIATAIRTECPRSVPRRLTQPPGGLLSSGME
ncbi:hypothetical protein SDC9_136350 [bioreactor metagenome]|uniref:Uncharacterized protein n=1 Tax=bioreactor metagenome TaxID=1076179 RepID=A0A645DL10_9ZZZZ